MPAGFRASTAALSFVPEERPTQEPYRMNLATVLLDEPTSSFAGVFTRNAFPGAPVLIGKERLKRDHVSGILVNNKIANVSSKSGVADATALCASFGGLVGIDGESLFPVSTGIIGWGLPVEDMRAAMPTLVAGLQSEQLLPVAQAIMTTDSFPKIRRREFGKGSIVGIAKGAGMIEPNLATMLVFILTDFSFDRNEAREILRQVSERSFNSISVDSDQSTSDMCLLLGSGKAGSISGIDLESLLLPLCSELAHDIVRNGEGTSHVISLQVHGRKDHDEARAIAKAVVNSPLVKTAIYGNDPNVGRILSSMGDYIGNAGLGADRSKLEIRIGDQLVFANGVFLLDKEKEILISEYFADAAMNTRIHGYPQHDKTIEIRVDFHDGPGWARVLGSDLTHEYVTENADYRS